MSASAKESNAIYELLHRYCDGMATPEEFDRINKWIEESEENYRTVGKFHLFGLTVDAMDVSSKVDIEKALANVRRKMTPVRKSRPGVQIWFQRIAAILFVPLLTVLLLQHFIKDGERRAASIEWLEVNTNPGMTTRFTLPDGTSVHLNSESSLRYPSVFEGDDRTVYLKGEGYFSVTEDAERPFIVSALHGTSVRVLGTEFNMEAFEADSIISLSLIKGRVQFLYTDIGQRQIPLIAGQKVVYKPDLHEAKISATNGRTDTAWKDGKIIFDNTPLEEALRILAKRYNTVFTIKSDELKQYSFTGNFDSQRLENILEIFGISSKIKWHYARQREGDANEKTEIMIYL
jgi:ferric-dicitrate binding protein FerR (iron transport regulator)